MKIFLLALSFMGILSAQANSCNLLLAAYDPQISKENLEKIETTLKMKGYTTKQVVTHASELLNVNIDEIDFILDLFQERHEVFGGKTVRLTKLNEPGNEKIVEKIDRKIYFNANNVYLKMINKIQDCQ